MTNEQLADLIRRVENSLGDRIDRLDTKIDKVEVNLDRKIGQLDEKIDDVAAGVRALNKDVHGGLKAVK